MLVEKELSSPEVDMGINSMHIPFLQDFESIFVLFTVASCEEKILLALWDLNRAGF